MITHKKVTKKIRKKFYLCFLCFVFSVRVRLYTLIGQTISFIDERNCMMIVNKNKSHIIYLDFMVNKKKKRSTENEFIFEIIEANNRLERWR
jgi:hypothetical protein